MTLDETADRRLLIFWQLSISDITGFDVDELLEEAGSRRLDLGDFERTSNYLTHEVFHRYRSETEMLRYIFRLTIAISAAQSMIPLGSCTMKLNSTSEMIPVTWPAFANIHPSRQTVRGYTQMFRQLEEWLCEVTGFSAVSL